MYTGSDKPRRIYTRTVTYGYADTHTNIKMDKCARTDTPIHNFVHVWYTHIRTEGITHLQTEHAYVLACIHAFTHTLILYMIYTCKLMIKSIGTRIDALR